MMEHYRNRGFLRSSPAHLQFRECLNSTVIQTRRVLPLSARPWGSCDPEPSRYVLTCLREPVQNVHFRHRVQRNALRGRGSRTTGWGGLSLPCSHALITVFPLACLSTSVYGFGLWVWFMGWLVGLFHNCCRPRRGGAAVFEPRRGP